MNLPKTPTMRLDGRRALVTGASSGIGLGAAVALAEAGANVTLAARNADKLATAASAFAEAGFTAQVLPLDITDQARCADIIAAAEPFDVLVNSAGLARHRAALQATPEDFDATIDANVRGAFFLTQAVAKRLVETQKPGSLINISSQMAHVGGIDRAVYCASKHAVEGFTKAMAIELGKHKIRINTICPTFILTPLTAATFDDPERRAWINQKIKLGRPGEVEDIMGAVVFLASDAASLITGSSLLIDGGWTAE